MRPTRPGGGIDLFSVAGIRVFIDYSWFVIFLLVMWVQAAFFRRELPPWTSPAIIWGLAGLASLLLFLCVLLHELSHSLVALAKGLKVPRITLFIFGGVSHLSEEPRRPFDEILLAIAGPVMSFVISGACFAGWLASRLVLGSPIAATLFLFLASVNLALGVFNLLPAFPLDGGRVLRAWLWHRHGSFTRATVSAARAGQFLAYVLMGLGVLSVIVTRGNLSGLWWVLIGLFLNQAAGATAERALVRQALTGTPVSRIMTRAPVTLPPDLSLSRAVEETFLNHHFAAYPVVDGGLVRGILALKDVKKYPREEWERRTVAEAMTPLAGLEMVHPDEDVVDVLERMLRTDRGRLPVVEEGRLVGMLTRRDIMDFLRVQTDLSETD